ncbi:MAG: nucleoside 2-deoxyribosyltransferase [Candidatus Doudnabacteria bacterium]|nr:nucleoside 2-deoxyribosyltransferase [Candidatus Doudnabacteria bacterium]
MKIFISFRYTGETYESLVEFFRPVCDVLESAGHQVFCSLWKEEEYKQKQYLPKEILADAFTEMDSCDALLAVVRSNDRSEGMLMELGYALAKQKRVYAAVHSGVVSYVPDVAYSSARFSTIEELLTILPRLLA